MNAKPVAERRRTAVIGCRYTTAVGGRVEDRRGSGCAVPECVPGGRALRLVMISGPAAVAAAFCVRGAFAFTAAWATQGLSTERCNCAGATQVAITATMPRDTRLGSRHVSAKLCQGRHGVPDQKRDDGRGQHCHAHLREHADRSDPCKDQQDGTARRSTSVAVPLRQRQIMQSRCGQRCSQCREDVAECEHVASAMKVLAGRASTIQAEIISRMSSGRLP
jgi:hypothetical protein